MLKTIRLLDKLASKKNNSSKLASNRNNSKKPASGKNNSNIEVRFGDDSIEHAKNQEN